MTSSSARLAMTPIIPIKPAHPDTPPELPPIVTYWRERTKGLGTPDIVDFGDSEPSSVDHLACQHGLTREERKSLSDALSSKLKQFRMNAIPTSHDSNDVEAKDREDEEGGPCPPHMSRNEQSQSSLPSLANTGSTDDSDHTWPVTPVMLSSAKIPSAKPSLFRDLNLLGLETESPSNANTAYGEHGDVPPMMLDSDDWCEPEMKKIPSSLTTSSKNDEDNHSL